METRIKSITDLQTKLKQSPELLTELKKNPEVFIQSLKREPIKIPWVFTLVSGLVALIGIGCILFIGLIALSDPIEITKTLPDNSLITERVMRKAPEILGVIATSVITAIAGLLAPSPIQN